jgi:hypothetical protein
MALNPAEEEVLLALGVGWTLKSHRDLDGRKEYRLHPLPRVDRDSRVVGAEIVEDLREQALIDSNKKFPAATYLLTGRGKELARRLLAERGDAPEGEGPLASRGWE